MKKTKKSKVVFDEQMVHAMRMFVGNVWLMRKEQQRILVTPEKMKLIRKRERIVDSYLKILVRKK